MIYICMAALATRHVGTAQMCGFWIVSAGGGSRLNPWTTGHLSGTPRASASRCRVTLSGFDVIHVTRIRRSGHAAVSIGSQLIYFGGCTSSSYLNGVVVFHTGKKIWCC